MHKTFFVQKSITDNCLFLHLLFHTKKAPILSSECSVPHTCQCMYIKEWFNSFVMSVGFGTTHDSFKVMNIFLFPYYHCYSHTHHTTYVCWKCPAIFSPHGSHHVCEVWWITHLFCIPLKWQMSGTVANKQHNISILHTRKPVPLKIHKNGCGHACYLLVNISCFPMWLQWLSNQNLYK